MKNRFLVFCLFCTFLLGFSANAAKFREKYEKTIISAALKKAKLQIEPNPTGKVIEKILIIREKMLESYDWLPKFLNVFHPTTKEYVIRQELLIKKGQRWNKKRIAETERNLRGIGIFITARLIPCKSKKKGHVVLLVLTKDVWSLLFSNQFNLSGSLLKALLFQPTEINFLGHNKTLGVSFGLSHLDLETFRLLDDFSLGQTYYDKRLFGSRWQLYERVVFYLNGDLLCGGKIGSQEDVWCPQKSLGSWNGMYATMTVAKPLFSLATKWGLTIDGTFSMARVRQFQQGTTVGSEATTNQGTRYRVLRSKTSSGEIEEIPIIYDKLGINTFVRYYHVWHKKHRIFTSLHLNWNQYTLTETFQFSKEITKLLLQEAVPRTEKTISFVLNYTLRRTKFRRLRNIETFAISEDISLGWSFSVGTSFFLNIITPKYSGASASLSLGHSSLKKDNLFSFSTSVSTRLQPMLPRFDIEGPLVNNQVTLSFREITPLLKIGRFHIRVALNYRWNRLDRERIFLGGSNGLRGYPSSQFAGLSSFITNIEFRSIPWSIKSFQFGFVVFYDGGSVFGGKDFEDIDREVPFSYKQSVGFGLRLQIPQLERKVFMIDFAVPLSSGQGGVLTWFQFGFGQAF